MPILFTAVFGLVALLAVLLLWVLLGGKDYRRRTAHVRKPVVTPPAPEPKRGEGSDGDPASGDTAD